MEKSKPIDQFDSIRAQILDRRAIFARQGSVVTAWRTRGGRRCGPYYRLAYREAGRQKSLYLGWSAPLADQVRGLLAELQQPLRDDRLLDRLAAEARASLRRANAQLNRVLRTFGFYLKGRREFRRLHGAGAAASPLRNMVSAWILHSRTAFRVEKSRVVDQQERSEQSAVGSGQKGGTTKDTKDTKNGEWKKSRGQKPEKSRLVSQMKQSERWAVGGGQREGTTKTRNVVNGGEAEARNRRNRDLLAK